MQVGEYLFKSGKGGNKAITTVQAYRIINRAAKRIKLEEIGTLVYNVYEKSENLFCSLV